jgi:hypothetical protein
MVSIQRATHCDDPSFSGYVVDSSKVTGAVDYDKAAKLTLHKSGKILKAVYERRVYEGEIGEHDDVEDSDAE